MTTTFSMSDLERVLRFQKRELGPRHLDTAATIFLVACGLQAEGRHEEAIALLDKVLEIRKEKLGPEHLQVADTMEKLGQVRLSMGQYNASLALIEEVLRIRNGHVEPKHFVVISARFQIGILLREMGQYDAAVTQFTETLKIEKEVFGLRHGITNHCMLSLVSALQAKGDDKAARVLLKKTLKIRKEMLRAGNQSVKGTNYRVSIILSNLHRFREALEYAADQYNNLLGMPEDHYLFGYAKLAEGRALLGLHMQTEAVAALRRSVAIFRTKLGQEHPDTAESRFWLAEALQDASEAERARAIRLARLGPENPLTLKSEAQVARLRRAT